MILSGNNLHMSCDSIYVKETWLQHSVSLTLTFNGKVYVFSVLYVCFLPNWLLQNTIFPLLNAAAFI